MPRLLTACLKFKVSKGIFGYHPKCKRIGLTHLSFVDDLLIYCKGNPESIAGIIYVLNHFYSLSGLKLNVSKTELFSAGIPSRILEIIHSVSGFRKGQLPVRYLGVPLVIKKLPELDCQPLLDKIKLKMYHWSSKHLSYAGRLELIKTVLHNVANYWCRQFMLPQCVINCIDQLCSRFLWKGTDQAASRARVNWSSICCPKSEGGLGLKNLKSWNIAYMIHLIRNILAGEGSLWVAWLNCYIFKNNLCDMDASNAHSWSIKKLLKLRLTALPILNTGTIYTRDIWEAVRDRKSKVSWHKIIWFPMHIPKFSMISWMAILDKLPTRDRLSRMGIVIDTQCVLCNEATESRNHLFVDCNFAKLLWNSILNLAHVHKPHLPWESMIEWACVEWRGKSLISILLKIAWTSYIYTIWEERNRRIFKQKAREAAHLLSLIKDIVWIQLSGKNINRLF
ncbi:uncharacterized protein LOC120200312 [Hibiscus syriacus]|uniref:uncharacterized protein LOC120200312 n=1 Tax=Hibiscus syriacus TaxID=106335 RepID=UPI001922760A|nr:uncharacterized protein LOC120200312 [Hibiscus syriacus]